jgi:hypothetical protein
MNRKIQNNKTIHSPTTYFKEYLYDDYPSAFNSKVKKIKVSVEDFYIPSTSQYNYVVTHNYNVKQLKQICKYYNLKVGGNKKELQKRTYNFLKYSHHAIHIQRIFKGYLIKKYIKSHGPALFNKKMCVNDTDFYTLDKITDIPHYQFFSYIDKDNFVYGFDICSLYNLIINGDNHVKNPYNRIELPKTLTQDLRKLLKLSKILNYPTNITIEDTTKNLTQEQKLKLRTISLFQKIDELGHYTNSAWLLTLNRIQLIKYIREIIDIWMYRAQLTNDVKKQICPPNGNPFINCNMPNIYIKNLSELRKIVLHIINNMISKGTTRANCSLGALYCLSALTLVNKDAAEAMPWLYDSVMHN